MDGFTKTPDFYIVFLLFSIAFFRFGGLALIAGLACLILVFVVFFYERPYKKKQ